MMIPLLSLGAALASEPVVQRGDDSRIEAYIDLSAAPTAVFALVSDPGAVARLDGTTQVQTSADGPCLAVVTRVEHPLASATYETRSCPDGELAVRQTLTGGDSMKAFDSRWWVEAREGGSRLHYQIRTIPALPIPQWVVDRTAAKSTGRLLEKLRDHLDATESAAP